MVKWAVNYIKNTFHPLKVADDIEFKENELDKRMDAYIEKHNL